MHNHSRVNSDAVSFKGQKEIKIAEKIVKKHTWVSGGLGFTLSQIIGVDSAAILANNVSMVRSIAKKAYKSKISKEKVNTFIAESSISTAGVKAVAGPVTFIPIAGNIANSAISAGITSTVGNKFIKLCEKNVAEVASK